MISGKVKEIHSARDGEIGIGIKAPHEGGALVAEVTLHLKHIFQEGECRGTAQPPAEFPG